MTDLSNNPRFLNQQKKVFYLVAGEASGDLLGGELITALKQHYPDAEFFGIGGRHMLQAGLRSFYPMKRLSVMGIAPIVARLPELLLMRQRLLKTIVREQANCFIGIDAPVFNTQLEFKLKKQGINTVHYVSPSLWAWRENRINKIIKSVSLMICLFPFELEIYQRYQLPAVCAGHPLADTIPIEPSTKSARAMLKLPMDKKILAILPGSRESEIKFLLSSFIETAKRIAQTYPELIFVIPCANSSIKRKIRKKLTAVETFAEFHLYSENSVKVMQASDYILLASGTATLEAMLLKKPMLVAYKVSSFSYWVYQKFLKINHFSLPNLLANQKIVTELIQNNCNPITLTNELNQLIQQGMPKALKNTYINLHQSLRLGGSKKAAKAIYQLVEENNVNTP